MATIILVMIGTKTNNAWPPHFRFKAGNFLAHRDHTVAIGPFFLIGYLIDKVINAYFGLVGFIFCHADGIVT